MSWSVSFTKPIPKRDAEAAVDELFPPGDLTGPIYDQCGVAKRAVKAILPNIPGPYIMVTMSGHANDVGWHKHPGWSNYTICVTVTQMCEEDLPNHE